MLTKDKIEEAFRKARAPFDEGFLKIQLPDDFEALEPIMHDVGSFQQNLELNKLHAISILEGQRGEEEAKRFLTACYKGQAGTSLGFQSERAAEEYKQQALKDLKDSTKRGKAKAILRLCYRHIFLPLKIELWKNVLTDLDIPLPTVEVTAAGR